MTLKPAFQNIIMVNGAVLRMRVGVAPPPAWMRLFELSQDLICDVTQLDPGPVLKMTLPELLQDIVPTAATS